MILLLLNVICLLATLILELKFYLKLLMPLAEKSFFFFCIADTYSKWWYYPRAQVVIVSLVFFRLWISISDICICKAFHWYNCTFVNHKWQTYFWLFFWLFCHHTHVCNILCCQIAVLIYEPESTEAKQFFPLLEEKVLMGKFENHNYNIYHRGILALHR